MHKLLLFAVLVTLVALLLRVSVIFYVLYILLGVYLVARLWISRSVAGISVSRIHDPRCLLGDTIRVRLEVENRSLWPVPWLRIHDHFPVQMATPIGFLQLTSLMPHEKQTFTYEMRSKQRGYYKVGPLDLTSGDIFGLNHRQVAFSDEGHVTVYPQIVPLDDLGLPSKTPFGHLRTRMPLYEDPARVIGVRDYQSGDSLRKINWKTTATSGRLQVKKYEPAMTLQTVILLSLNLEEYEIRNAYWATEMAIVVAASVASHLAGLRQEVGLITNGVDPLVEAEVVGLPPRKGREHVTGILELLGRVNARTGGSFCQLLRSQMSHLPWGATLMVIASHEDEELWSTLLALRRAGFSVVVVFCDYPSRGAFEHAQQHGASLGFACYRVWQVEDMDVWRRRAWVGV